MINLMRKQNLGEIAEEIALDDLTLHDPAMQFDSHGRLKRWVKQS